MFGLARSGTTFLNKILDEWFDYGMGPEGVFVPEFARRIRRYGDLSDSGNLSRLLEDIARSDMLRIARTKYPEEIRFDVTADMIRSRMLDNSYAAVVFAVFECVAEAQNKRFVGNKNPGYWKSLDLLGRLFPTQAKYLCIVRDGRDVALSTMAQRSWGEESIYMSARRWVESLKAVETFAPTLQHGRMLVIRYEDLLGDPRRTVGDIDRFLGNNVSSDVLERAIESIESSPMRNNFFKWRARMDSDQLRVFESVAGPWLEKYRYERATASAKLTWFEPLKFEALEYRRLAALNIRHLLNQRRSAR